MTPTSRTDWTMVDELVARAGTHTPDYLDEVLAATARVRQRPAWTFPSRWLPAGAAEPHPLVRYGLILALLGLALVGGLLAWAISRPPELPRAWANGVIAYGVDIASYEAAKNGGALIFTIDPASGDVTPPNDLSIGPYAFSPDGTRFAFFVVAEQGSKRRLYTSAADGSQLTFRGEVADVGAGEMAWSPDGRWIVASHRPDPPPAMRRITVFATDGSGMASLDVGDLSAWHPSWAPTSDRIVFAGESPDGSQSLYTIPVDGSARAVPLVDLGVDTSIFGMDPEPVWSPDGRWIAYVRDGSGDQVPPKTNLHLVRPDGSEDHALGVPAGWISHPEWSPDSRSLLVRTEIGRMGSCVDPSAPYCGQWIDQEAHLLIVPLDGSPARRVGPSSTAGRLRRFAWSPDGRMIVASIETSEDSDGAALIDVASNTWRVVGVQLPIVGPLSWQPIPAPVPAPGSPVAQATASPTGVPSTAAAAFVISGTLTDTGGTPLAGVAVQTEATDHRLSVTGADGTYRLELTAPGAYRLRVGPIPGRLDHPVYVGPDGWTMNPNLADGSLWSWAESAVVDLVLPDATQVSGTFVDADGAPYRSARIDVSSPDTAPASGNGTLLSLSTTTDEQGRFSLLVMPGRWDLMVDGGDYQGIVDQITVGAEPITGLVITRRRP